MPQNPKSPLHCKDHLCFKNKSCERKLELGRTRDGNHCTCFSFYPRRLMFLEFAVLKISPFISLVWLMLIIKTYELRDDSFWGSTPGSLFLAVLFIWLHWTVPCNAILEWLITTMVSKHLFSVWDTFYCLPRELHIAQRYWPHSKLDPVYQKMFQC